MCTLMVGLKVIFIFFIITCILFPKCFTMNVLHTQITFKKYYQQYYQSICKEVIVV